LNVFENVGFRSQKLSLVADLEFDVVKERSAL